MPDEKIAQKLPRSAEAEPKKAQQEAVDDAVDDSFPASDPPAWTTTGAKSIAARSEDKDEGAPALEDVRTATEASAAGLPMKRPLERSGVPKVVNHQTVPSARATSFPTRYA